MKKLETLYFKNFGTKINFVANLENFVNFLPDNSLLITDNNVEKLYRKYFTDIKRIVIQHGEKSKNFDTIQVIISELIKLNADRNWHLTALGGGVVCDITGFVASIYKRGVKHSFIPTTLLAQVDAAIGGKTGINFEQLKNVVGTFKHPENIIISTKFLKTLDKQEFNNGLAELLKIAIIKDKNLLKKIPQRICKDNIDESYIIELIKTAIKYKMEIVDEDFHEKGIRKILNFGHTFGHSIEIINNISHGKAILEGMKIALTLSEELIGLEKSVSKKIKETINQISDPELILNKAKIFDKIYNDKKVTAGRIDLVLLKDIGMPIIYAIEFEKLKRLFYDLC